VNDDPQALPAMRGLLGCGRMSRPIASRQRSPCTVMAADAVSVSSNCGELGLGGRLI